MADRFTTRRVFLGLAASSAIGLIVGCAQPAPPTATSSASPAPAAKPTAPAARLSPAVPVTVRDAQSASYAPLYIGIEKGYFEAQGLDVRPVNMDVTQQVPQLGNGQLDVGQSAVEPDVFNAFSRGVGLRIVGNPNVHEPGRSYPIVARTELVESGRLSTPAGLKGLKYATSSSPSISVMAIERALKSGGLTLSDIDIVTLSFPLILAALTSKNVDVAFLPEPFATNAVSNNIAVRWKEEADFVPNYPHGLWLYSENFIKNKLEAARRFMLVMLQGAREYEDAITRNINRDALFGILARYTSVKDLSLYPKMSWVKVPPNGELRMDLLQEDVDWLREHGGQMEQSIDLSKLVDMQFTNYAVETLGKYS